MLSPILAILLTLAPAEADADEEPTARVARMTVIADAVEAATRDEATQAAIVTAAWSESRLASAVMLGECPKDMGHCDKGKARGIWQLHPWCKAAAGNDIAGQAVCARKALRGPLARCGSWAAAFGGYASGHGCVVWPDREALRVKLLSRIQRHKWLGK